MTSPAPTADVLIAGGGIAGLACGASLADAGLRVCVFEAQAHLGGRAASFEDMATGTPVDIGPHVLTSEHRNFLALLERLGTADAVCWQPRPLVTLLDAGRVLRMQAPDWPPPLHGLPNLRNALRCVAVRDLLSNFRVAWHAARLNEAKLLEFDGVDALQYLRRMGVTERFIGWFWYSATLALLNVPLAHCSAASLLRIFRLMIGRSGYCFGFPRTGLATLFAPGCRARIEAAGGHVVTAEPVLGPLVREGRFAGFLLGGDRQVRAAAGVLALPPQAIAAMADRTAGQPDAAVWLGACKQDLCRFEPVPYVSTMLWLDRKVTQERFWARVWREGDLNTDFYDLSNIRPDLMGGPSLIASNAIHAHRATSLTDDQLIAQTVRELTDFAPGAARAQLLHARVHRIPMAVPAPQPGTECCRPDGTTGLDGLRLAGDWTATGLPCSMESAARSGALAAEAIGRRFGLSLRLAERPPDTVPPLAWLRSRS